MDYANPLFPVNPALLIAVFIWSIFWKILALWRCAKNEQRYWFVGLILTNTIGILEIIYLFRFSKKRLSIGDLKNLNLLP